METDPSADTCRVLRSGDGEAGHSGQRPGQGAHRGFLIHCGSSALLPWCREHLGAAVTHGHSVRGRTLLVSEHRCA